MPTTNTNTTANLDAWYQVTARDPAGGLRTIDVRLCVHGDGTLAAALDGAVRAALMTHRGVIHVRSVPLPGKEAACEN